MRKKAHMQPEPFCGDSSEIVRYLMGWLVTLEPACNRRLGKHTITEFLALSEIRPIAGSMT